MSHECPVVPQFASNVHYATCLLLNPLEANVALYGKHSIDLYCKSVVWFLHDDNINLSMAFQWLNTINTDTPLSNACQQKFIDF